MKISWGGEYSLGQSGLMKEYCDMYKQISENKILYLTGEQLDELVANRLKSETSKTSDINSIYKGLDSLKKVIEGMNIIKTYSKTRVKIGAVDRHQVEKVSESVHKLIDEIDKNIDLIKTVGPCFGQLEEEFNKLYDIICKREDYEDYVKAIYNW